MRCKLYTTFICFIKIMESETEHNIVRRLLKRPMEAECYMVSSKWWGRWSAAERKPGLDPGAIDNLVLV